MFQRHAFVRLLAASAIAMLQAGQAQATTYTEIILHQFSGTDGGASPEAGPTMSPNGTLLGTTYQGGTMGGGVLFAITPAGTFAVLRNFGGTDGATPRGPLTLADNGDIYGTMSQGGDFSCSPTGCGTVFRIATDRRLTVLYRFPGGTKGSGPFAGITLDPAGNMYGTTLFDGSHANGTVYKITPDGRYTVLHSFVVDYAPYSTLFLNKTGDLLGTAAFSSFASYGGSVYEIDPAGDYTTLHQFEGYPDGEAAIGGVIPDRDALVGAAEHGGAFHYGAIYGIRPSGEEGLLYSFTCGADSGYPASTLIRDSAGNLYGTTLGCGGYDQGIVFEFNPTTGTLTTLHAFNGASGDGAELTSSLAMDKSGDIYGTTSAGGINNRGIVFELRASP